MSYRHIDTIAKEDWFKRPWMLLGTGPSLDRFKPEEWRDHNIAAIYDAFYACDHVDILFAPDDWADPSYSDYPYYRDVKNRYVATRGINAHNIGEQTNVVMWDYDCDYTNYMVRIFPNIQQYRCSNTSAFVVMWLGAMGVKKIKTYGIDGGRGYSKHVSKSYLETSINNEHVNNDRENEGVFGHATILEIELIKL